MNSSAAISALERQQTLERLARDSFDVVVIGGGIAGAGVARQAARRGWSVALLEAEDFACGTSSKSTKLVHGGLRYLAQLEFGLVRESALERKQIFRLAPHLAEPRWMVLPIDSWWTGLKYRAGVSLYERLGAVDSRERHRSWGPADLAREEPALDRTRWPRALAYREYLTDDARLVLANLRAAAAHGAAVANHLKVEEVRREHGVASGVSARCGFSGACIDVRARCIVNAAGPWVDAVVELEEKGARDLLHLSKGVHITVSADRVPLRNMLYVQASDGRLVFAIRRGRCVYVGTTDTTHAGPEVWPEVTLEDVRYLLEPLPRYLRIEPLDTGEIESAWAGLRPLVAQPGRPPSEISRKDEVFIGSARMVTMAGGKLTGYRPAAERALLHVAEVLGRALPPAPPEQPLPGGDFDGDLARLEASLVGGGAVQERAAERLARLYGAEVDAVIDLGAEPLAAGMPVVRGEVEWAVRSEAAATLEDLLYRRLRVPIYDPDVAHSLIAPAARQMAALLGWSEQRVALECERVRARLEQDRSFEP
jgi:glycerol-3-phosphate dehydrogenase